MLKQFLATMAMAASAGTAALLLPTPPHNASHSRAMSNVTRANTIWKAGAPAYTTPSTNGTRMAADATRAQVLVRS